MKPNKIAIILTAMLILLAISNAHCQDTWNSTNGAFLKYDKLEHGLGCAGLYTGFRLLGSSRQASFIYTMALGTAWEIKDHFMSYKKYGWWGGEYFSWLDLAADFLGTFAACFIDFQIFGAELKPTQNGISLTYRW